jgi:hypothetical protein
MMPSSANFPRAPIGAGMYESFYLRAVAPEEPVGIWIRNTVHKAPGQSPRGSVWCTVFDASRESPFMHKLTSEKLKAPPSAWIEVGEADPQSGEFDAASEGARMALERAQGSCGAARWSLSVSSQEPELRHLPREWMYRAPLPRTKLTSPAPAAIFNGVLEVAGEETIHLHDWRGMVGHNWGAEHAERWIWLHGVDFDEAPEAWLDVAIGRVSIAGRMTPWIANGALALDGRRYRIGGLAARGLQVAETVEGCALRLKGERGLTIDARVEVPPRTAAGWRYADPDSSEHDVVNCSIASVALTVELPGGGAPVSLHSAHGGTYELGMRERDHGVPIAPFADG